ncbi:serine hydrolase [Mesorhizobium sp. J428]|uniref:serine hydrolase domain-containing protein n=1 Tax=Mesorhizobium sp. J428 TaxID=2898440 RepID=UPI002151C33B|nr:serine hydrolase domain-containing protein [Mesorhizobium sp. J428]MCR5856170.1 beta-lactamase family protein [Mesorhizobium sp. J428]
MLSRAEFALSMFSGARQIEVFNNLHLIFPVSTMTAAPRPRRFPKGVPLALPETYRHDGTDRSLADFLEETDTVALMVIEDGRKRYENYWLTGGPAVNWMSMSVAKSFTSAALGIAWGEGLFGSVDEIVSDHLPQLRGSAYDGVSIKDVLQMSSGARWNEDYSDPESDMNRFISVYAHGGSFDSIPPGMIRHTPPGTYNLYNSMDTHVLGMLLKKVTGRPIRDYVEEKLWHPLGMEDDAHWLVDSEGMEMAFGGLMATARDFAKLGELFRLNGRCDGKQIVPEAWVKASVTPDGPHLIPGDHGLSDTAFGYGYQWWLMDGENGEFSAIGVYNQFVYVHPDRDLVIVKLSASPNYGQTNDETSYREFETVSMFRAIAKVL